MKKIKVIDLYNMISKGEEVPKKIKVHNTEYHKCLLNTGVDYKIYSDDFYYLSNEICKAGFSLNDEVEIIEENKLPEKINVKGSYNSNKGFEDFNDNEKILVDKINEILDYLESQIRKTK